jgi:hypothetical protein
MNQSRIPKYSANSVPALFSFYYVVFKKLKLNPKGAGGQPGQGIFPCSGHAFPDILSCFSSDIGTPTVNLGF